MQLAQPSCRRASGRTGSRRRCVAKRARKLAIPDESAVQLQEDDTNFNTECEKRLLFETPKKAPRSHLPASGLIRQGQRSAARGDSGNSGSSDVEEDGEPSSFAASSILRHHSAWRAALPEDSDAADLHHPPPPREAARPTSPTPASPIDSASCPWMPRSLVCPS